jgi:hypothetical protein
MHFLLLNFSVNKKQLEDFSGKNGRKIPGKFLFRRSPLADKFNGLFVWILIKTSMTGLLHNQPRRS